MDRNTAEEIENELEELEQEFGEEIEDKGDGFGWITTTEDLSVSRRDHHRVTCYIESNSREEVRIGDYVRIPYSDSDKTELFGVVDELRYDQKGDISDTLTEANTSRDSFNEKKYKLLARISPIAIIIGEKELSAKTVDRIPRPKKGVHKCEDERYLRTGLGIPEEGPFVGHMSVGGERAPSDSPLEFRLPNPQTKDEGEAAIYRHTIVAGSTGTGKTHFSKNLLRQLVHPDNEYEIDIVGSDFQSSSSTEQRNLGMVVIDPENEYTELASDNPDLDLHEPVDGLKGQTVSDLRDKGIKVGGINDTPGSTDLRVFVPNVDRSGVPSVGRSQDFSIPFEIVQNQPQLMMPFEAGGPTSEAIKDCINEFFQNNRYQEKTYENFMDMMQEGDEHINGSGHHQPGSWVENYNINESMWGAVMRRVDQEYFTDVFDSGPNTMTSISDRMFRPGRVTVIPTRHLSGAKERLVVMCVLAMVVENKLKNYNLNTDIKNTPLALVLDEAHNYLSEPSTEQERYIVEKYRSAARQGRKHKLGLYLVTQNPNDIDEEIVKQINTSIYLGLEPGVINNLSIPGDYDQELQTFSKGQAVVKVPDVRTVEVMGLPVCLTKHSK